MTVRYLTVLAALVAALTTGAVAVNLGEESGRPAVAEPMLLPELRRTVDRSMELTVEKGGGRLTIRRKGDSWILPDKYGYRADQRRVRKTLFAAARLEKVGPRTRKPGKYAGLGVDAPGEGSRSAMVDIRAEPGQPGSRVLVGKIGPDLGGGRPTVFVRLPDSERAWLARGAFDLSAEPLDWIDKEILDISDKRVRAIAITPIEGKPVRAARENAEADFTLEGVPEGKKQRSTGRLDTLGYALSNLTLTDVRPAADWPEGPAGAIATFAAENGLTVNVATAAIDGESWIRLSATASTHESGGSKDDGSGGRAAFEEAERINRLTRDWLFKTPRHKQERFETQFEDLIENIE